MTTSTEQARSLRKNATEAERRLWQVLRRRQLDGHKFRRQQPLGGFIVDFVCVERGLIVEVDGGHHFDQQGVADAERDAWLRSQRFRILRFSDRDVLTERDGIVEVILRALEEPPP